MTDILLLVLAIAIPVVGFVLFREVRSAFAYHFAGLATQLENGGVKVHIVDTPSVGDEEGGG